MSVEQARKINYAELTPRQSVGVAIEVGALAGTAAEILMAGLAFWPIAIGGAIFLLGRGIVKSEGRRRRYLKHSGGHH